MRLPLFLATLFLASFLSQFSYAATKENCANYLLNHEVATTYEPSVLTNYQEVIAELLARHKSIGATHYSHPITSRSTVINFVRLKEITQIWQKLTQRIEPLGSVVLFMDPKNPFSFYNTSLLDAIREWSIAKQEQAPLEAPKSTPVFSEVTKPILAMPTRTPDLGDFLKYSETKLHDMDRHKIALYNYTMSKNTSLDKFTILGFSGESATGKSRLAHVFLDWIDGEDLERPLSGASNSSFSVLQITGTAAHFQNHAIARLESALSSHDGTKTLITVIDDFEVYTLTNQLSILKEIHQHARHLGTRSSTFKVILIHNPQINQTTARKPNNSIDRVIKTWERTSKSYPTLETQMLLFP